MLNVHFYDRVEDEHITFVVIIAQHQQQWLLCKHKQRDTYECPGGHREAGESVEAAAMRELWEETGAAAYTLTPICVYSVQGVEGLVNSAEESFGMLYHADITSLGELPSYEIGRVELFRELPERMTYPDVHPKLVRRVAEALRGGQSGADCEKRIVVQTKRLRIMTRSLAEMRALREQEADAEMKKAYGDMLRTMLALPNREEWGVEWRIERLDSTTVGGLCFKGTPDADGSVELGYGINEEYWRQGYATEAVRAMTDWALAQAGVKRVCAQTELGNAASQRVLAKCGFVRDGDGEEGPMFAVTRLSF